MEFRDFIRYEGEQPMIDDLPRSKQASTKASRLGARLGNWNDRHSRHDTRADASLRWRILDRVASWLYVR